MRTNGGARDVLANERLGRLREAVEHEREWRGRVAQIEQARDEEQVVRAAVVEPFLWWHFCGGMGTNPYALTAATKIEGWGAENEGSC